MKAAKSSLIVLRVPPPRKAAYVQEANRRKVTLLRFITATCDKASGYVE